MKKTFKQMICSILALVMTVSTLLGTTFAWFTDSVTSGGNIIQSGKLEVGMHWSDKLLDADSDQWQNADGTPVFNYNNWEPGYTEVRYIKVANEGTLNLKWTLSIQADGKVTDLSDVIDVYYFNPAITVTKDTVKNGTSSGSLTDVLANNSGVAGSLTPGQSNIIAIAFHMDELAGNEYQGKSLCEAGFSLKLLATQDVGEFDSFDDQYDVDAKWPYSTIKYSVSQPIAEVIDTATGTLTEDVTIGDASDDQYAEIPSDVKLADGADKLTFTVTSMEKPNADVNTTSRDEILRSVDIHVDGIAEDNTVPMRIVLKALFPKGLNSNNVMLYHVEGNETKKMTYADTPVNHNEFSYDPNTGDAVVTISTFSEVATYANTDAGWDGTTVTSYTVEGDTIKIANAEQFAYFRDQVDAGNDFAGKTVILTADINLNGHLFDPIGWGYDNSVWNRNGAAGKVFKGHFDGGNNTIYGLYQNGWDLDPDKENYSNYTYTNCGFGLFASALDATFENLNINGADIRVECVETGVLVGLAQGSCTFRNINILGCRAANYQRPVGGVVGEVSPKVENGTAVASEHTFDNVYVDSNTVVGSMWGDFDAPVGGVIGAYWDDAGKTSVKMTNVTVACRLDVYNDVTSTYQWYAYRRAGMLIGNTDRSEKNENGTNIASTKINGTEYLSCSDVTVYYGNWTKYNYCEFNEANPNWPWVRVEPGEYCEGYSNPRWGRPTDPVTKEPVTDSGHYHGTGEGHMLELNFHQLYGGGQGVYGQETHNGVSEGIYTVTYMDHGKILHVDNIIDNQKAYDCEHDSKNSIWSHENVKDANGNTPSYWVKADNTKFEGIGAGNTANVIVYPKWPNEYTIRCLDTYGNVAYYDFVIDDKTTDAEYEAIATKINETLTAIQNELDKDKNVMIIVWENSDGEEFTTVTAANIKASVNGNKDFILSAVPQLQTTSISLKPYYNTTTGELEYFYVDEVAKNDTNSNVVIPAYVGKYAVKQIGDNAAAGFANLHCVTIPSTVTSIGKNAFAETAGITSGGETVTIYFEGTKDQWDAITKDSDWDSGLGTGSRIFFLNGNNKVDTSGVYLQLASKNGGNWSEKSDWSSVTEEFTSHCDCKAGTTGDKAHTYVSVDENGKETILGHNEAGTPVNTNGDEVIWGKTKDGYTILGQEFGAEYGLTDVNKNTNYKRYRPDYNYWVGVTPAQ